MKPNPRRIAALVGGLAIAAVTATGVIAGTASAAGTATCTSSVNVRSEPAETAPIVGVCERGSSTTVGETRNGFVELPEFGGWAVDDYVSTSSGSAPDTTTDSSRSGDDLTSGETADDTTDGSSTSPSTSPSTGPSTGADDEEGAEESTGTDRSDSPSTGQESTERSGTSTAPDETESSRTPSGNSFLDES